MRTIDLKSRLSLLGRKSGLGGLSPALSGNNIQCKLKKPFDRVRSSLPTKSTALERTGASTPSRFKEESGKMSDYVNFDHQILT